MFPVGLSSCSKELDEKLFAAYRAAGITRMELSADAEALEELDFGKVKALADKHGIALWSMHIPFSPFYFLDPSDPEKQETTLAYFRWCIKKGAGIGIRNFVVHPSAEPIAEEDRPRRMETAKQTLASSLAACLPWKICLAPASGVTAGICSNCCLRTPLFGAAMTQTTF